MSDVYNFLLRINIPYTRVLTLLGQIIEFLDIFVKGNGEDPEFSVHWKEISNRL